MNLCRTCANRRADTQCGRPWVDPVDGLSNKFMACKYCRSAEWACGAAGKGYDAKPLKLELNRCPFCGEQPGLLSNPNSKCVISCSCGLSVTGLNEGAAVYRWNCLRNS